MKKRKIVGAFTILAGLPGLAAPLLFFIGIGGSSVGFILLALGAFMLRGLSGVIGGVLIWKGSKRGYYLTIITWLYLITVGLITLVQLHTSSLIVPSFELTPENSAMYLKPLANSVGKVLWGSLILFLVFRDLRFIDEHGQMMPKS